MTSSMTRRTIGQSSPMGPAPPCCLSIWTPASVAYVKEGVEEPGWYCEDESTDRHCQEDIRAMDRESDKESGIQVSIVIEDEWIMYDYQDGELKRREI